MSLVARLKGWREDRLVLAVLATPGGRLVAALLDLSVRDRALTLAGQAFIALVPLGIVVATVLGSRDGRAVGDWLIDRYGLDGATAEAVRTLFDRPPDTTSGVSFLGVAILLVSFNSFARTLQRTYEGAWGLPPRAPRRTPHRLASMVALVVLAAALVGMGRLADLLPGGALLAAPIQLVVAIPLWCLAAHLLVSRRVSMHDLVPGAVISAVSQVLAGWAASIWVPILIERNAERYGVIGVAVALISWLVVLSFVLVAGATAGAWAGRELTTRRGAGLTAARP